METPMSSTPPDEADRSQPARFRNPELAALGSVRFVSVVTFVRIIIALVL